MPPQVESDRRSSLRSELIGTGNMKLHFDLATVLQGDYGALFLHGIELTLAMAALAWTLSLVVGILLTLIRLTNNRLATAFVATFVAYHRNVPMLVQILFWYFGISNMLPDSLQDRAEPLQRPVHLRGRRDRPVQRGLSSEDIRSGLRAISYGQYEASRALGTELPRTACVTWCFRKRCATRFRRWSITRVCCSRTRSLAMAIGAAELTYVTRKIENETFLSFESYLVATVLYLGLSLVIMLARRQDRDALPHSGSEVTCSTSCATTGLCCSSGSIRMVRSAASC